MGPSRNYPGALTGTVSNSDGARLPRATVRLYSYRAQTLDHSRFPSNSANDPLYRFHRWQANLRVLGVIEVKSVPYVPMSHPFVEWLIGTIRPECLDQMLLCAGLGTEVVGVPRLLRHSSGPGFAGWTHAGPDAAGCRNAQPLRMGRVLPRTLSDADCGLKSEQGRRRLTERLVPGSRTSAIRSQCFSRTS